MKKKKLPLVDRFWRRVQKTDSCWLWTGAKNGSGYGNVYISRGKWRGAHRFSYEITHGPIPDGLQIDHLCRTHACVNPAHLEAVTPQINVLRGVGPCAIHAAKTSCKYGHPFTPENTYRRSDGARGCKTCRAQLTKRMWRTRKQLPDRNITFLGETLSINEWAERLGMKVNTIYYRLTSGWPVDEALTAPLTPPKFCGNRKAL